MSGFTEETVQILLGPNTAHTDSKKWVQFHIDYFSQHSAGTLSAKDQSNVLLLPAATTTERIQEPVHATQEVQELQGTAAQHSLVS